MPGYERVKTTLSLIENDHTKVLGLKLGDKKVVPGQYIPRAEAQSPPELSLTIPSSSSASETYLAVSVDIDAPFPSLTILGPILHWIQPGLKPKHKPTTTTENEDRPLVEFSADEPFVANYIGPAPPPGSSPHRYLFILYEQPDGFEGGKYAPADGRNLSNWYRMRYDLDYWAEVFGLGSVVACNYFVSN